MFEGLDFPKSIEEDVFNRWIENGKASKIGYRYLLIIWDEVDREYRPLYVEQRSEITQHEMYKTSVGRESRVAAYDLYSESRIL